jgi:hypothetical protein
MARWLAVLQDLVVNLEIALEEARADAAILADAIDDPTGLAPGVAEAWHRAKERREPP